MIVFSHIKDINAVQWQQLVENSPTSTFFQTRECYDFYSSLSFLKPVIYGLSENDKLVAIVCGYLITDKNKIKNKIKNIFNKRVIVPGGFLLDDDVSTEGLTYLLKTITEDLRKKAVYIEIRNHRNYSAHTHVFENQEFYCEPYLNFYVPTYDVDTALGRLNDAKRSQLKVAKEDGYEWIEAHSPNDILAFYRHLQNTYKRDLNRPLFPIEFFEKLVELPHGKLFIVRYKGEIVGGKACVYLDGNTMNEVFASRGKTVKLNSPDKVYSDIMVTWSGIEYAAKNSIQRFDFIGIPSTDANFKSHEFKRKIGGQAVDNGMFIKVFKPGLYFIRKSILDTILRFFV